MSCLTALHHYTERPRYFCSFGGALSALEALADTIPIMHSAPGCSASIAWGQSGTSALNLGGYCGGLAVPGSNIGNRDAIFGGEERLAEQIRSTVEIMEGKLFVVITGCVTEMIGDDVEAVVREFRSESPGTDIVFAKTGGFMGNSYLGYDIVMSAIAEQFVRKSDEKKPNSVNILGIVPFMDSFWRGNLQGIRNILEPLGLTVNTFFTQADSLEEIRVSSGAALNIVVSDVYGVGTAETYERNFGIPYIVTGMPVGPSASVKFIHQVSAALSLHSDVETIIEKEMKRYYKLLEPMIDVYYDSDQQRYAVIVADVNYGVSLTRFLFDDLGWIPVYVQFPENLTAAQQKQLAEKLRGPNGIEPRIVFDANASEANRYISQLYPRRETDLYTESLSPAFVLGSSLERDLAQKLGAPHLSVSFPVANRAVINRGYTGFAGGLTLIEDLLTSAFAAR
jgi:nitrogenase molybdenum-iron protein beta chain